MNYIRRVQVIQCTENLVRHKDNLFGCECVFVFAVDKLVEVGLHPVSHNIQISRHALNVTNGDIDFLHDIWM